MAYQHSLRSDLDALKRNVRERYTDNAAVLKELLQNADDASARLFAIGSSLGLENAENELLRGPFLFAVNDAPFGPKDAVGIRQASGGSKSEDDAKIGRFGLGLKSVHRLSEVLFHLSDRTNDDPDFADRRCPPRGVINPWEYDPEDIRAEEDRVEAKRRRPWSVFSPDDQQNVLRYLQPVLGAASDWFVILLPLRSNMHVSPRYSLHEWRIEDEPNAAEDLTGLSAVSLLAGCLPLLESVEQLHFWREEGGRLLSDRLVNLEDGARRLWRGDHKDGLRTSEIKGEVTRAIDGVLTHDQFNGRSIHCDASILDGLDMELALGQKLRTKARGGAVVITERPASDLDPTGVYLRWAVYLPLSQDPVQLDPGSPGLHISITFHGTFYSDSGRQRVELPLDTVGEATPLPVTTDWNGRILREGCLPNVIPALEGYLARYRGEERRERARAVVAALARGLRNEIGCAAAVLTRDGGFAEVPDRGNTAIYRRVETGSTALGLPPWREGLRIRRLFPALFDDAKGEPAEVAGGKVIWVFDGPHLLAQSIDPKANWTVEQASWFIAGCQPDTLLAEPGGIDYLVQTLGLMRHETISNATVQDSVAVFIRRLLGVADKQRLRGANKTPVCRIIKTLCDSRVLRVPRSNPVASYDSLTDALNTAGSNLVFAPADLAPETASGTLELDEARKLLEIVSNHPEDLTNADTTRVRETKFKITEAIVAASQSDSNDAEQLRKLLAGLPLLPLRFGCGGAEDLHTIETLIEMGQANRVFRLFNQRNLTIELLEEALKIPVAVLHSSDTRLAEWFERLLGKAVPNFEVSTIVECLGQNDPHLVEDEGPRKKLFTALGRDDEAHSDAGIRVLRRLLAGSGPPEDFDLFQESRDDLARKLLSALCSEDQYLGIVEVKSELLDNLPKNVVKRLRAQKLDIASVARWWRGQRGANRRMDSSAEERVRSTFAESPDEARRVACQWPKDDGTGLRALPIFQTTDRRMVNLADELYPTEGGMDLGEVEIPDLTLLRLQSDDQAYASCIERLGCKPLSPDHALKLGLGILNARQREQFMLRCLEVRHRANNASLAPVAAEVRQNRWLLTKDERAVAPDDVLRLNQDAEKQLHTDVRSDYCLPRELACAGEKNGLPKALEKILPSTEDSLSKLGKKLSKLGHGASPLLKSGADDERLDEQIQFWLDMFSTAAEAQPAAPLVASLSKMHRRLLVRELAKAKPTPIRFTPIIEAIRDAYEDPKRAKDRSKLVSVLCDVLAEAIKNDAWQRDELPKISLLTRAGKWAPAGPLTFAAPNVPPSACLRDELADVLRVSGVSSAGTEKALVADETSPDGKHASTSDAEARASGRRKLEFFCNRWIEAGLSEQLALMPFALLGDNDDFAEVYRTRIGEKELESIRRRAFQNWTQRALGTLEKAMESCNFLIEEAIAGKVEVRSLDGRVRLIDAADTPDVFLETEPLLRHEKLGQCRIGMRMTLRAIDPPLDADRAAKDGSRLWKATLDGLIEGCYGVMTDLDAIVGLASEPEQHSLEHARLQLQDQLEARLEQPLRLRASGTLREKFDELKLLQGQRTTAKLARDDVMIKELQENIGEVEAAIVALIRDDESVQGQLLKAIRKKLDELSYESASIPFELFQNADDAAGEAAELFGEAEAEQARVFHLDASEDRLIVIHHGRPINQFKYRSKDLKKRYFGNDLANMLALNASDKRSVSAASESKETQTGHFGLGFKSVLYFSDRPQLFSGRRLALEIRGGVLPVSLGEEAGQMLKRLGSTAAGSPPSWGPTVLRLPRRDGGPDVSRVVDRFIAAAPLAVCFARRLRQINIHSAGSQNRKFCGVPKAVLDTGSMLLEVHAWERGNQAEPCALLIMRDRDDPYLAVAVVVGAGGVVPGGMGDLPRLWVTCPTAETERPWFAINANFDLNPGRTQLHEKGQNPHLIAGLRPLLRAALDTIRRAAESKQQDAVTTALAELGVKPDAGRMAEELARLIPDGVGENPPPVRSFLHELQVGDNGALAGYYKDGAGFATGLGEGWPLCTTLGEVKYVCDGLLSLPEVRQATSKLLHVIDDGSHPVQHLVSRSRAVDLRRLGLALEPEPYNLKALICSVLEEVKLKITDGIAGLLEPIFILPCLQNLPYGDSEIEPLRSNFQQSRFTSAERTKAVTASEMIVPWHDDESLLVADIFGPARTLAKSYYQSAPALVLWIVRGPSWTTKDLAVAFREAKDVPQQTACLKYALKSGQRFVLLDNLNGEEGWWTALTPESPAARGLGEDDRQDLGRRLVIAGFLPDSDATERSGPVCADSGASYAGRCAALAEYCEGRRSQFEESYDKWIYPNQRPQVVEVDDDRLEKDLEPRREWMLLLIRGSLFSMGRATESQHKAFLNQKTSDGRQWLDIFSGPAGVAYFEPWAYLMRDTIERRSELSGHFAYWLSNILNIYQMNLFLPTYVRVLKSLPQQMAERPKANPQGLIDVRFNPAFSGSNIDAPTLLRPLGAIGLGFVLRELFRFGVYESCDTNRLREHAFANKQAVRELVGKLTGHEPRGEGGGIEVYESLSSQNGDLLDDPFLGGLHDLPLHLLASHPEYQHAGAQICAGQVPSSPTRSQ